MSKIGFRIRILIADDHTLFREGLRGLLEEQQDFRIVGEAPDGRVALELVRKLKPDILLLDSGMPRLDGMDVLRELGPALRGTRVILLASVIEKDQVSEVFRLGAHGLMLKEMTTASLIICIRSVAAGKYVALGEIKSDIKAITSQPAKSAKAAQDANKYSLTKRELEILALIIVGSMNREIAHKLSISAQTVKHHLTHIFDKLGVYNRLELALFAIHHGLAGKKLSVID